MKESFSLNDRIQNQQESGWYSLGFQDLDIVDKIKELENKVSQYDDIELHQDENGSFYITHNENITGDIDYLYDYICMHEDSISEEWYAEELEIYNASVQDDWL